MITRMDKNVDEYADQMADWLAQLSGLVLAIVIIVWLFIALCAYIVAPRDRAWGFFWCTLLILGPIGVAVALLAQPRPSDVG
jgi:hypothetical protein